MLPLAINPFFAIIMRNFIMSIPQDIFESVRLDGASELQTLAYIILPLSKAAIAAITLFYAVFNWNAFFHAVMLIIDSKLWPIQVWLRQFIEENTQFSGMTGDVASIGADMIPPKTIQMAVIVVATVPILFIYPLLQKHFAKGVMLGAVKG